MTNYLDPLVIAEAFKMAQNQKVLVRAESRFSVRREVGRDDADQERSQNRPAAIQRLSLTNLSASPVGVAAI